MKIVKNFYDMAEERRKKEERRYQNTRKTPEKEQREHREAETLIRVVETFEQNTCLVPDKEKEAEFEELSLGALEAAELLNINVTNICSCRYTFWHCRNNAFLTEINLYSGGNSRKNREFSNE